MSTTVMLLIAIGFLIISVTLMFLSLWWASENPKKKKEDEDVELDMAILSVVALDEWNTPEEDEAWEYLGDPEVGTPIEDLEDDSWIDNILKGDFLKDLGNFLD